jgi:hypothetical protein
VNLSANDPGVAVICGKEGTACIAVDPSDYPVVKLAADLFASDVQRLTGQRPVLRDKAEGAGPSVIVGTLGHSALVDQLVRLQKLKGANQIKGRWEATLLEIVENPLPGTKRALVIAGSDRRGTAYGLMQLSEKIGVSPWYWWADVPVLHQDGLALKVAVPEVSAPGVRYRGIFLNDEDWGLYPWASKTFEPEFKNIGPKTYAKVFELMLRLRLNYLWPAMHACSVEFGAVPENVALADKYAIVAGASHCEPMLCNNVHWDQKTQGRWNYATNREVIHSYWEENVKARATEEAVWGLGIRGIHDGAMQAPPSDMPGKIRLLGEIFKDQRDLLDHYVTQQWGPVAQCFVPYKEVLPVFDAGLKVPEDVTLVWVDDNFGYIRRLGAPKDFDRPGGAGVYYHLSYFGAPHSYTWINTTAPALVWEELHKAWENQVRSIWVVNVGDIKPMEIGIDYFARLAWNPEGFSLGGQPDFLRKFASGIVGERNAREAGKLLMEYYRLGTVRKPELMERAWALSLPENRATQLRGDYENLLKSEETLAAAIPAEARGAYFEMIGFPARVLGASGLIFLADRAIQLGDTSKSGEVASRRAFLEKQVEQFNNEVAQGKWKHMMPGLTTGKDLPRWSSQVRWPWGEKPGPASAHALEQPAGIWRDAAAFDLLRESPRARWVAVPGLGPTGRTVVLKPATQASSWQVNDKAAPALGFTFESKGGDREVLIDFLPTFRLWPGMNLRVGVSLDNQPAEFVEVPGSNGQEDEKGPNRHEGIQNNCVQARLAIPKLKPGRHVLEIRAVDPGAAIDRVFLPEN